MATESVMGNMQHSILKPTFAPMVSCKFLFKQGKMSGVVGKQCRGREGALNGQA